MIKNDPHSLAELNRIIDAESTTLLHSSQLDKTKKRILDTYTSISQKEALDFTEETLSSLFTEILIENITNHPLVTRINTQDPLEEVRSLSTERITLMYSQIIKDMASELITQSQPSAAKP